MSALGLKSRTFPRGDVPKSHVEVRQARFLAAYAETGMVSRAARWAKLERSVHASWMKSDPTYPQRFNEASDTFTRKVEDTLHLVGVHGVERPILYKGKQVFIEGKPLFENRRSEMILKRIAEARMPELYKRRVEQLNIQDLRVEDLTPELLDKLADHLIQQVVGNDPAKIAETRKQIEAAVEAKVEGGEPIEVEYEAAGEVPGQSAIGGGRPDLLAAHRRRVLRRWKAPRRLYSKGLERQVGDRSNQVSVRPAGRGN